MPPRNRNKTTRSSSRNRGNRKESLTTSTNSLKVSSPAHANQSPARSEQLPSAKKNKTKTSPAQQKPVSPEGVSDLSFTFIDTNNSDNQNTTNEFNSNQSRSPQSSNKAYTAPSHPDNERPPQQMGDNRGSLDLEEFSEDTHGNLSSEVNTSPPPSVPPLDSSPEDPWHNTYNELKVMRSRMGTLEKVEAATLNFAQQLQILTGNFSATEKKVSANTDNIKKMEEEIKKLRTTVENQQQTIQDLQKLKDDFKNISHKNISEMNVLVDQQREQVETIRTLRQDIKSDAQKQKEQLNTFQSSQVSVHKNLQQQITQAKEEADHKSLLHEAFKKRHNLIITNLPEKEDQNDTLEVNTFFKNQLKLTRKMHYDAVYRIGRSTQEDRSYNRPLLVKFSKLIDRNLVWRQRHDIPQAKDQPKIKIQADLPKKLRDNTNILYRIIKAASGMEDFKSAFIRDFAIVLHGKQYTADNLELLPPPLRPSSLAVRESDEALVFFSRFCFLSNHFPSKFEHAGLTFHNMEHFLAFKKAELSQQDDIIRRALQTVDPVEAKSILNFLRKDYSQEWQKIREEVTMTGLREKFRQNKHLADLLKDTRKRKIGEASNDPCWGVGFTLDDPQVLDLNKWNKEGNLLGNLLMKLRSELTTTKGLKNQPAAKVSHK